MIENHRLGYKVKSIIKRYHIHREAYPNGPLITLESKAGLLILDLEEYTYYEQMSNVSREKTSFYNQNRRKEYFGSQQHFLKSIYYDTVDKAGFEIIPYPKNSVYSGVKRISDKLNLNTSNNAKNYMIQGDSIAVNYKHRNNIIAKYMGDILEQTNTTKFVIHTKGKIFQIYPDGKTANTNYIFEVPSKPHFNSILALPHNYLPYH